MFTDRPAREVLVEGSIAVVGGGLAGLVAAFELATRGANVVLFESSDRLGGKAGADKDPVAYTGSLAPRTGQLPGGVESDHGYHIFPKWYVNMRALWHRVGIDAHADVVEGGDFLEIPPAVGGQRAEFRPEASIARADLLAMAELITEPDDVVNGLTLQAYLTSRDYIEYKRDSALNNLVLNALTVGDADLSARAIRNVFRQWLPVFHHKNWDMMRGSLDEKLIQPIAKAFVAAGGHICLGHSLTGLSFDGQRMEIEISDRNYASLRWNGTTILAVPFEVLARFDSSVLYESGVPFSRLHKLRANQFAALDVFFTRRLPGITREHFSLAGSRYGLTAVDVGQHWPALMERDRTVLQFVIGRSVEFKQIEDLAFLRAMRDEIGRYLPGGPRPCGGRGLRAASQRRDAALRERSGPVGIPSPDARPEHPERLVRRGPRPERDRRRVDGGCGALGPRRGGRSPSSGRSADARCADRGSGRLPDAPAPRRHGGRDPRHADGLDGRPALADARAFEEGEEGALLVVGHRVPQLLHHGELVEGVAPRCRNAGEVADRLVVAS